MPAPSMKTTRIAAGIAGMVAALLLLVNVARVVRSTGGWTYSLDDAYIHLAIANTLRHHAIWGLTPANAAGASSSPLWTLLMAAFGAPEWLPLLLNVVLTALGTAWLAGHCTRRSGSMIAGIVLGVGAMLLTNAPRAAAAGMEHLLHGVLSMLFLGSCLDAAFPVGNSGGARERRSVLVRVGILATLAIACRAESLLVVGIGIVALIAPRARGAAAMAALGAAGGLASYAAIGLWQRIPVIPNSVALKVLETDGAGVLGRLRSNLLRQMPLALVAGVALIALVATLVVVTRNRAATRGQAAILMATSLIWGHLMLAKVTHAGRYEVYLLVVLAALTLPEIAEGLRREKPSRRRTLAFVATPMLVVLVARPQLPLRTIDAARWSEEIDASPREIERFIQQQLPEGTVLLNDVGAVSYFTRARVLDLWGLGNNEVCRERLRVGGVPSPEWIEGFALRERADVAMIFDSWFDGEPAFHFRTPGRGVPASWTKIGEFRLNRRPREIVGGDAVAIYAVHPADVPALRAKFAAFRPGSKLDTPVAL